MKLFKSIKGWLDTLRNPLTVFWHFLRDRILGPIWDKVQAIFNTLKNAWKKITDIGKATVGKAKKAGKWARRKLGLAEGGYITMAQAGAMGSGPYIVGEMGPELFMPQRSGQVIPHKDLNTQRVKDMLRDAFGLAPRDGAADKAGGVSVGAMRVGSLIAGNARMKKTRLGVDTFA